MTAQPASFTPPAAHGLPDGALDSATTGATMLDARAGTDYGRNVLAHALVQLQHDGWLREAPSSEPVDYDAIDVPPRPTTDAEFAALPVLDLAAFRRSQEAN